MMKLIKLMAGFLLTLMFLMGCEDSPEEQYLKWEKQELATGLRYDSLFMGIYFQMPQKKFREHCYQLNLDGKFKQGGKKNTIWVEYKMEEEMDYPAAINFYPTFENDVITEMNAAIYYDDHAVFRDGIFESDSLLMDVLNLMDEWYGKGFVLIKSPVFYQEDVYVKVTGNRRITVYPDLGGQKINVWYVDLLSKKEDEG